MEQLSMIHQEEIMKILIQDLKFKKQSEQEETQDLQDQTTKMYTNIILRDHFGQLKDHISILLLDSLC